jgi:amphi-Trp domain-containing protein
MGKKGISFKARLDQGKVIAYLEQLLDGLKSGTVYVQQGNEYVALSPANPIKIAVSASQKEGKEKISFEMTWGKEEPIGEQPPLRISMSEPEIQTQEKPAPVE